MHARHACMHAAYACEASMCVTINEMRQQGYELCIRVMHACMPHMHAKQAHVRPTMI